MSSVEGSFSPESTSDQSHLYKEVTIDDRKNYICLIPDCGKEFRFKSEMNRHLAVHSKQRPHVCTFPQCGKTFKRADALSNHIRMHNSNMTFICPIQGCGNQFATKSALKYHILKHQGQKRFKCRIPGCNRAFITLAQLKQHEKASFYHQKVGNTNQINKDVEEEEENIVEEAKPLVKEEIRASNIQAIQAPNLLDTANLGGAYKLLKTDNNPLQMNNVLHKLQSLNQFNMAQNLAWTLQANAQANAQTNLIGSINAEPKVKDTLRSIVEENQLLKDRLKDVMARPFGDLYSNFNTFPANMNFYGFQPNDLARQRLAALQYNFTM